MNLKRLLFVMLVPERCLKMLCMELRLREVQSIAVVMELKG